MPKLSRERCMYLVVAPIDQMAVCSKELTFGNDEIVSTGPQCHNMAEVQ